MSSSVESLRSLIEKWLAPTPASPITVTRMNYAKSRPMRCVRVESLRTSGTLAIFFFRHLDGSWCVFPPAPERPTMRAFLKAE